MPSARHTPSAIRPWKKPLYVSGWSKSSSSRSVKWWNYHLAYGVAWYGNEAAFVVHRGCAFCQGTGKEPSQLNEYDSTLEEMRCSHCAGRGHEAEYLTADELWQIFMPRVMQEIVRQLPSIVERSKLEVIRAIMDS